MVTLDRSGLRLPGEPAPVPLWSGAIHYFRTSPAHWRQALQTARDLGLPLIETYVPWGVHEIGRSHFRFSGQHDLGRFLDLCGELGLRAVLRPGPHINAELPWFGFPERLVNGSDPGLGMRTANGQPMHVPLPPRMFIAPSYATDRLYEETARWYEKVAEVVAGRLYPKGPVVALQVDNEQPSFFRTAAYDGDYHEQALSAWERWQAERGLQPAPAPRAFPADATGPALLPHLRWLAFKEGLVVSALGRLGRMLGEAGLTGVPLFHNFPPAEPGPFDVAAAETVLDCAGIDMYHRRDEYDRVRRRALYLLGSSRYPYVPEMGAGSFPWGPPLLAADGQQTLLNALAHGVRGFNLYMLAERDRWYGAPLAETGQPREQAAFYQRVLAGLRDAGATDLSADAPIGVLLPREYERLLRCASHAGPISPMYMDWLGWSPEMACRTSSFGLDVAGVPLQQHYPAWRDALLRSLERQHRRWAWLDASCPDDRLAAFRALVVPTYDLLDRGLAARLRRFVAAGGTLVLGPVRPGRDEDLSPCDHGLDGERVHLLSGLDPDGGPDLDKALRAALPLPDDAEAAFLPETDHGKDDHGPLDVRTHRDPAGRVRLVGVGNPGPRPAHGRLALPGPVTLRDLDSGEKLRGEAALGVDVPGHGTRLFVVE